VLLGMAAAKRGTLDATTSKMLFLHVPARHPATYPELELSPLVQAAALLGVGLLYQGSCHRRAARRAWGCPGLRISRACAQPRACGRPALDWSGVLRRRPAPLPRARVGRARAGRPAPPPDARARARRLTTESMIEEIGRRPGGGGGGGGADGDGGAPRNNADAAGATGAVAQVIHPKKWGGKNHGFSNMK